MVIAGVAEGGNVVEVRSETDACASGELMEVEVGSELVVNGPKTRASERTRRVTRVKVREVVDGAAVAATDEATVECECGES